jgi:hypothetical protein
VMLVTLLGQTSSPPTLPSSRDPAVTGVEGAAGWSVRTHGQTIEADPIFAAMSPARCEVDISKHLAICVNGNDLQVEPPGPTRYLPVSLDLCSALDGRLGDRCDRVHNRHQHHFLQYKAAA